ncbi:hypothetical protein EVA_05464 [gut metagenome]|uniref:Uncharacterized protein n=1 Tax=gut metagenome TaxID=749906 RepID=J9GGC0_9ZZZZ
MQIGNRRPDREFFNPVHQHDVAGFGFIHQLAVQPFKLQDLIDLDALGRIVRTVHDGHIHIRTQAAAVNTADTDLTDIARIVERADLQHQRTVRVIITDRHIFDHRIKNGTHIADLPEFFHVIGHPGKAVQRRSVNHREVQLIFRGAQLIEEVEGLVDHPVRTSSRTVDLIDDDNRLQASSQSLTGYEAGLRHRAFNRVNQQQNAVHHREDTFNFTAEVRVPRGVNDINVAAFVFNGTVLGQNGNAAFLFNITGVHHAFGNLLVVTEGTGTLQKTVNHRGLTVVNVGNDRNITDRSSHLFSR